MSLYVKLLLIFLDKASLFMTFFFIHCSIQFSDISFRVFVFMFLSKIG